jgi:hypothetical protein
MSHNLVKSEKPAVEAKPATEAKPAEPAPTEEAKVEAVEAEVKADSE